MRTPRSSINSLVALTFLGILAALLSGSFAKDTVRKINIEPPTKRIDRLLREQDAHLDRAQERVLQIEYAIKNAVQHRAPKHTIKAPESE